MSSSLPRPMTTRQVADEALQRTRLVSPGSGGGGLGSFAFVTTANSPYAVKPTDSIVEVNDAAGQVTVLLPPNPSISESHIIKKMTTNQNQVIVNPSGNSIESGTNAGTFGTGNTSVSGQGAFVRWEWDGTQWVIVG